MIHGSLVAFSSGAVTGPTSPFHSQAMPETRISQGMVLVVFGIVLVGIAVYLVWFYDND